MRTPLLAALAALAAAAAPAQPGLDVTVAGGAVARGSSVIDLPDDEAPVLHAAVHLAPGLPRGLRAGASLTATPGTTEHGGRLLAAVAGLEAPLTGGRNGLYVALGLGAVDFDGEWDGPCELEDGCFYEGAKVRSYAGAAASVGAGARVPLGRRLWVEPAVSALVWGDALPQARLGLGWRVR